MSWDEKAADAAIEYAKPQMRPVQTLSDHLADAFHAGARWQREALLSDEAIERAARAMDENFNPDRHPIMAAMFRDYAKAALTAAIGDDDEFEATNPYREDEGL